MTVLTTKYDSEQTYLETQASKGPYSAIVYIESTSVIADDADGTVISSGTAGTNDTAVIQAAINSLTVSRTWQEKVILAGKLFQINAPLSIPDYTILDLNGSVIKLKTNSNCDMINNADQVTRGNSACAILGPGWLDGNGANQNGAGPYKGVHWKNPGVPLPLVGGQTPEWGGNFSIALINLAITQVKGTCAYFDNSGGVGSVLVDNCQLRYGLYDADKNGSALYLDTIADSVFRGPGYFVGRYNAIYMTYCNANSFSGLYVAGTGLSDGIVMDGCSGNTFTDVRTDAIHGHHWNLCGYYGNSNNNFVNCICSTTGTYLGADNTYDAFHIAGDGGTPYAQYTGYSCRNTFVGCSINHLYGSVTNKFRYGYSEENVRCDYNIIDGFNGVVAYTAPTRIMGPHSKQSAILGYNAAGVSVGTGSNQSIAHSLANTPTRVSIVPTMAECTGTLVWADEKNLYIKATLGKTYNWSAEV